MTTMLENPTRRLATIFVVDQVARPCGPATGTYVVGVLDS
jgi:hypothetical protein